MNKTGIYKIVNKVNGKYYVGSASYIDSRWSTHRKLLDENIHFNPHLQSAWKKYGKHNFQFILIEKTLKSELLKREQYYLDIAKNEPCYNINFNAERPFFGHKHTLETRKKISQNTSKAQMGSKNHSYIKTTYKFHNRKSGMTFVGTRCDFYTQFKLSEGSVRRLIKKERKSHKDWILV